MDTVEKAIESAYTAQISGLYKVLIQGFARAKSNAQKKTEAQDKFRRGLTFAAEVRDSARAAAGL
ncbi:MAG: hypothetical protein QGI83_15615 [Candidatus Latescibacteria bacterium]|jgi:hypothetical protein|nr:hypothetical protein [Candidatus Latescibacterota bacterium]